MTIRIKSTGSGVIAFLLQLQHLISSPSVSLYCVFQRLDFFEEFRGIRVLGKAGKMRHDPFQHPGNVEERNLFLQPAKSVDAYLTQKVHLQDCLV